MALTAKIAVNLTATETGANDFGGPLFTPSIAAMLDLTDGVAALQADRIFVDERTVLTAANDDLDLNGVLIGAMGTTFNLIKVVAVLIINANRAGVPNTTNLTIGAGTNPFLGFLGGTTPTIGPLRPGAFLLLGAGDLGGLGTVTPTTADILRIANSAGASNTYQVAILGRSA